MRLSKTNTQIASMGSAEFQTSKHVTFRALFSTDFLGTGPYSFTMQNLQQKGIYSLP